MADEGYLPIGERIRYRRRARGLSQLRLGGLIDRSEDWVSKVERSEIPVDRISVLLRIADALKVPLSDLLGTQNLRGDQARAADAATPLRHALTSMDAPDEQPRELDTLERELIDVMRIREQAHYAESAAALPPLLADLQVAAARSEGDERLRARRLLARAYGLAAQTLVRYGEHDSAWVAADRAVREADASQSTPEWTLAAFRLAHAQLGAGRLDDAASVADTAIDRVSPERHSPAVRELSGALHLRLPSRTPAQETKAVPTKPSATPAL